MRRLGVTYAVRECHVALLLGSKGSRSSNDGVTKIGTSHGTTTGRYSYTNTSNSTTFNNK